MKRYKCHIVDIVLDSEHQVRITTAKFIRGEMKKKNPRSIYLKYEKYKIPTFSALHRMTQEGGILKISHLLRRKLLSKRHHLPINLNSRVSAVTSGTK